MGTDVPVWGITPLRPLPAPPHSAYWVHVTDDADQKLDIDWVKTLAGALAAVSSAVLLSTLGAAGTLLGAALGSVIATVGGALYSQGLARSKERLAAAHTAARRKVGVAQAEVLRASRQQGDEEAVDAHLAHAQQRLEAAKQELDAADEGPVSWRDRIAALPWKRIAVAAAVLFAGVVLAITAFEMLAGKSVSSITGGTDDDRGTTISDLGGADKGPKDDKPSDDDREPAADPSDEPSEDPSQQPSPSASPTDEPSPTESSTPTPTPTLGTPSDPASPLEPSESSTD